MPKLTLTQLKRNYKKWKELLEESQELTRALKAVDKWDKYAAEVLKEEKKLKVRYWTTHNLIEQKKKENGK